MKKILLFPFIVSAKTIKKIGMDILEALIPYRGMPERGGIMNKKPYIAEYSDIQLYDKNMKHGQLCRSYTIRAYTSIELVVTIAIVGIIAALIFTITIGNPQNFNQEFEIPAYLMPAEAQAQAQQRLVREIAEQNRLLRQQQLDSNQLSKSPLEK